MSAGWPMYLRRAWPVALVAALAVSLLVAQDAPPAPSPPATQPATQPAPSAAEPHPPSAAPWEDEASPLQPRAHLLSGLIGSKHDFTHGGRSGRDLCLPCHTPHLVSPPPTGLDRQPTKTQPLRPYQTAGAVLDGWSLLCLGCHDGVTAPDVYSSGHATTIAAQLGRSSLGSRGLRSHPVGVKYPRGDERYQPPLAVEAAGLVMPDGRIQCATCHDAHNTNGHTGLLRMSNERSRMCLTCHRL
jgi:predicted CXXCH cytochrome family protein